MIRLLVCHRLKPARDELRRVLGAQSEIAVVGEAESLDDVLPRIQKLGPDIALVDVRLPPAGGTSAVVQLRQTTPSVRVVACAAPDDAMMAMELLDAGAASCYLLGRPLWELERALVGVSGPLARVWHRLERARDQDAVASIAADELALLTGAALVESFVVTPDRTATAAFVHVRPAGPRFHTVPAVVRRALDEGRFVKADDVELAELSGWGLPCSEIVSMPLLAAARFVGAVLLGIQDGVALQIDEDVVSAVVNLASAALSRLRSIESEAF